jgi:hypothetical protein
VSGAAGVIRCSRGSSTASPALRKAWPAASAPPGAAMPGHTAQACIITKFICAQVDHARRTLTLMYIYHQRGSPHRGDTANPPTSRACAISAPSPTRLPRRDEQSRPD